MLLSHNGLIETIASHLLFTTILTDRTTPPPLFHPYLRTEGHTPNQESMEGAGDGPSTATNPRGIPIAPFVDRVEDYVSTRADVEGCLRNFQEMIS